RDIDRFAVEQFAKDNAVTLQKLLSDNVNRFAINRRSCRLGNYSRRGGRNREGGLPPLLLAQYYPATSFIHAINRLPAAATIFNRSARCLAQRRQQRAQTSETVSGDQSPKHQLTQGFFDHARQEVCARDNVDEE